MVAAKLREIVHVLNLTNLPISQYNLIKPFTDVSDFTGEIFTFVHVTCAFLDQSFCQSIAKVILSVIKVKYLVVSHRQKKRETEAIERLLQGEPLMNV